MCCGLSREALLTSLAHFLPLVRRCYSRTATRACRRCRCTHETAAAVIQVSVPVLLVPSFHASHICCTAASYVGRPLLSFSIRARCSFRPLIDLLHHCVLFSQSNEKEGSLALLIATAAGVGVHAFRALTGAQHGDQGSVAAAGVAGAPWTHLACLRFARGCPLGRSCLRRSDATGLLETARSPSLPPPPHSVAPVREAVGWRGQTGGR